MELTDVQRAVLAFERDHPWWRRDGAREQAVRDELGLSLTRHVQVLNELLDSPAAALAEPQVVARLRRLRDQRRRVRTARRASA